MKILSYHPFSLFANGGGNRILRRLYQGYEAQVTALVVEGVSAVIPKGNIPETLVHAAPVNKKWMRWPIRNIARWMRNRLTKPLTIGKVQRAARKIDYDVLHVVSHGPFCAALCTDEFCGDKELWVSFHDHFDTIFSTFEDTKQLWQKADRRLVISEEIAAEYTRLFGAGEYELITDGVKAEEIKQPRELTGPTYTIYFAGLLHLKYMPLFETLAHALDNLSLRNYRFKFILRGTQRLPFLADRKFETEYRPVTLNNEELKAELDAADILYLPIKFSSPEFFKYSLSTKMVGYLGAPGAILYHGPEDSAACHLLDKAQAAICTSAMNAVELEGYVEQAIEIGDKLSANAKNLARQQFDMDALQKRFWRQTE